MYERIGYYLNPSDAVCADDAPARFADDDFTEWQPVRGWEEPSVIFDHTEADSCQHCMTCGRLIPQQLTGEGLDDVAERLGSGLGDVTHDMTALAQWWDEYGEHLDEDQLRDIITEAVGARMSAQVTVSERAARTRR